jgi:hypothetical protein
MTRARAALLSVLTFVIGAVVGGGVLAWSYSMFVMEPVVANSAAAEAGNNLVVLESLRSGDIEKAITMLEIYLDGHVVVLGLLPESSMDPMKSRLLNRVAQYRARFPRHSTDAEIDKAVADVLEKHRASARATQ